MKKKILSIFLLCSLLMTGCSKLERIIDILLEEETEVTETEAETAPEQNDAPEETDVPEETELPVEKPEAPEKPALTDPPEQPGPEENILSDTEAFVGDWVGSYVDENGDEIMMYLTMAADGGVSYSYGYANSEIAEMFGGTWGIADAYLALNLTGGIFDMEADYVTDPYSIEVLYNYNWGDIGKVFNVTLQDGTPLLNGTEEVTLDFWYTGAVSAAFDPMRGIQPPVYDPAVCVGDWYATCWHEDGYELAMHLTLNADGTAAYNYGLGYSDTYEMFEGTWTADSSGKLTLDMFGGWVYAEDSEQYNFKAAFRWNNYGSHLSLVHEEGNPLIGGCEGWYFDFLPFDFTMYDGEWVTFDEDRQYSLHLLSNGEAFYIVTEEEMTVSWYEGWWRADDDMNLELSVQLTEGEGDRTISCTYTADWAEFPTQMILELQDGGFALTTKMAVSGSDIFSWIDPNAVG